MGPFGFEREPCVFFASFAGLLAEVLTAIDPLIYNPREDNVGRLSSQIIGVQEKKSTPEPIVNGPVSFQFGNCPLEVCPQRVFFAIAGLPVQDLLETLEVVSDRGYSPSLE